MEHEPPAASHSPFVIVTPVLDGWPRVRATVASVASQRDADLGVHHIVQLHTGSSDASRIWLEHQPRIDLRIETDQGLYDAISRGFAGTSEPYLGWLNSDEQLLPGALVRAASVFESHPGVGVLFGDYLLLDAEGHPVAARREIPARLWYLRHGVNSILSCATFFRREVWEQLGGFDPQYQRLGDKDFYLRALNQGIRFLHVPEFWGAFGMTGANRSNDVASLREQAALRQAVGAYRWTVARRLPRAFRCIEKALRGAYRRQRLFTELFGHDGVRRCVSVELGTRWRWE